jgi:hypothetical protein
MPLTVDEAAEDKVAVYICLGAKDPSEDLARPITGIVGHLDKSCHYHMEFIFGLSIMWQRCGNIFGFGASNNTPFECLNSFPASAVSGNIRLKRERRNIDGTEDGPLWGCFS